MHIAPIGDFTGSDADGKPVPEKITKESLEKLAGKLNETDEILCDVDHAAARKGADRNTKAAGWFSRWIVDPIKGLFATLKLTKHGKELIENREYRYVSPSFILGKDGTPEELHSVSLTNVPAFTGHIEPVLNQAANEENLNEGIITMEITKDDLIQLIKDTVTAMNSCSNKEEIKNEEPEKAEETKTKTEEVVEEVKEEIKEEIAEEKAEEKDEEKEEEVIKIEALNSAPTALGDINKQSDWMNLHGDEFFAYLAKHPEIKG